MDGYGASTYGESFADVYDEWYEQIGDVEASVDLLADLGDGGPALELGVGTGRISAPLSRRGLTTVGIDTSPAMLARLEHRNRGSGTQVTAVLADMTALPFGADTFRVAFAAYNTLFNLTDAGGAARCFEDVRRVLRPDGTFVVESFVAGYDSGSHNGVEVRTIDIDRVVLTASVLNTEEQTITGQHIEIRESGIRLRPWFLRYLELDQLDAIAIANGMRLHERWAGWRRQQFTAEAEMHVSLYRPAPRYPTGR